MCKNIAMMNTAVKKLNVKKMLMNNYENANILIVTYPSEIFRLSQPTGEISTNLNQRLKLWHVSQVSKEQYLSTLCTTIDVLSCHQKLGEMAGVDVDIMVINFIPHVSSLVGWHRNKCIFSCKESFDL